MNLLNPAAIWLLALLPLLILLYFLKLRRLRKIVTSTLLWRRMVNDGRVNTPFQRLRRAWLLILQIAALLVLAAAAMRPLQMLKTEPGESLIILMDCSASMQATVGGERRFDEAIRSLSRLVDELSPTAETAVVSFADETIIRSPFTNNRHKLADTIAALAPLDTPGDPASALELAAALVQTRPQARVVLISDAAPAAGDDALPFEVEFIQVGAPAANAAITAIEARRLPDAPDQCEIHLSLRRFGTLPDGLLELRADGRRIASALPSFDESGRATLLLKAALPDAAVVEARLNVDDALAIDNVAWCTIPPTFQIRIALENTGADTPFLKAALSASPIVRLVESAAEADAIVRTVAALPESPPSGNELLLLQADAEVSAPQPPVDWDDAHPLTRHVDLSTLMVSKHNDAPTPEAYQVIVRIGNQPLVSTLRSGAFHRTVLHFSPQQSNWPLQAGFPLFLHNWISHLQRLSNNSPTVDARTGVARTFGPAAPGTAVAVDGPAKSARGAVAGGRAFVSGLTKVGVYQLRVGDAAPLRFAVNLLDAAESNTTADVRAPLATAIPLPTVPPRIPASREWTTVLLGLALALLMLEWSVFHRIFPARSRTTAVSPS